MAPGCQILSKAPEPGKPKATQSIRLAQVSLRSALHQASQTGIDRADYRSLLCW